MKKVISGFLLLLIVGLFSCNGLRIEKRRYNKGFFIHLNRGKEVVRESRIKDTSTAKVHPINSPAMNLALDKDSTDPTDQVPSLASTISSGQEAVHLANKKQSTQQTSGNNFQAAQTSVKQQQQKSERETASLVGSIAKPGFLFLLGGLVMLPFASTLSRRKISIWASKNKSKSRLLLIFVQLAGMALAYFLGTMFSVSGVVISPYIGLVVLIPYLLFFLHKQFIRKDKSAAKKLHRSKNYIGLNFITGMFGAFVMGLSNFFGNLDLWSFDSGITNSQMMHSGKDYVLHPLLIFLLTVLAIGVFLILLGLAASLSCSLSCSGYGGAAVVALIGGVALSIYLFILMLRGIWMTEEKRDAQRNHDKQNTEREIAKKKERKKKNAKLVFAILLIGFVCLLMLLAISGVAGIA